MANGYKWFYSSYVYLSEVGSAVISSRGGMSTVR